MALTKKSLISCFPLLFIALLSSTVMANTSYPEELANIAHSWEWKKLLQYNENQISEIDDESFFFSPDGPTNPLLELSAFLKATKVLGEKHMACSYPGRYQYLSQAKLVDDIDYTQCESYAAWLNDKKPTGVTLIFADGYLKNPASFHGHLLIRLDSKSENNSLLDSSLNFGAIVPNEDDPITYIVKGLFGGYQAKFSSQPFYRHNLSYGQQELRNLWEYQLDLTEDQAALLAGHLYELSNTEYQYYFMDENCAYFVARALELTAGKYLTKSSYRTYLPTEAVKAVMSVEGKGGVSAITVKDSQQHTFQRQFQQLDGRGKAYVRLWVNKNKKDLSELPQREQKNVLITLSSYFSFRLQQSSDPHTLKKKRHEVLSRLLSYSPGNTLELTPIDDTPPHNGQPPALARVEHVFNSENDLTRLTFRPTYYDRLQPSGGRLPHSAMSMGELSLSIDNNVINIERLLAINIETLNLSSTGLPEDGGASWLFRIGAHRQRLREYNAKLSAYIEGGYGKAVEFNDIVTYGFIQSRAHTKELSSDNHSLTASLRAGFEWMWFGQKAYLEIEQPYSITSSLVSQKPIYRFHSNLFSNNNIDARIGFEMQDEYLVNTSLSYYF